MSKTPILSVPQPIKTQVAHLIFNPVAGHGNAEKDLALIKELLEPHLGLRVHQTTREVDPAQLVQNAIAQKADLIIASGGDGTVSAVAGALINKKIPLGVIPSGTANAFSAALGIPALLPIRNACQIIVANRTKTVDAAYCNGTPMILLMGIGFEVSMIEGADRERKVSHGEGEVVIDDGLLDITIATSESKLNAIATLLSLFGAAAVKTEVDRPNVLTVALAG